jgi:hypothetical protein
MSTTTVTGADYAAAAATIQNAIADGKVTGDANSGEYKAIKDALETLGYTFKTGFLDDANSAVADIQLTVTDKTRLQMLVDAFRGASQAAQQVQVMDFGVLDIDSIMMLVQSERARLLDSQIVARTQQIKDRSNQISQLNQLQAVARGALATFSTDAEPDTTASVPSTATELIDKYKSYNVLSGAGGGSITTAVGTTMTKANLEKLQEEIKAAIDSLNSTQQLEMTSLQSLTNKRNEAFETITNFISKVQKTKDAVVGNLR